MTKEELQNISFQIISSSGSAFSSFFEAVETARTGNFEKARQLITQGEAQLNAAHRAQTDLLTAEAGKENFEFSIIAVHGQDHLMNAVLYDQVARQMIGILEDMEKRRQV